MAGAAQIAAAYGIDPALAAKIEQVAAQVGISDPGWLANLINFESNGFNPQARNPFSTATGLIQFVEPTARELGTTTDQLARMSALQQMDYVRAYFQLPRVRKHGPLQSQLDVYMAVFWPEAIGKGPGYVFPIGVAAKNPGIFRAGDYAAKANARAKLSTVATAIMGPTAGAAVAQAAGAGASALAWVVPAVIGITGGVLILALIGRATGGRRRRR